MKFITYSLFILFGFQIAVAQNARPPLSTDRPDQTEAPFVVPLHSFQIETGILLGKDNPETGVNINTYGLGSTLLRYSIFDEMEFRLSGVFLREEIQERAGISSTSGFGDITVGAKFHLLEEDGIIPQTGVIASLDIPLGDQDFTENDVIPAIIFVSGYELTSWASLSWNLGGWYQKNNHSLFRYSLAMGFSPLKKIGIFVETFGSSTKSRVPRISFDLGMTYLVRPNFQLDTAYGFGLTDNALDSFFNFGLSWRLPN